MKKRPSTLAWTLCLFGVALLLVGYLARPEKVATPGAVAVSGSIGGNFTLTDQDGNTVTNKSWPGKYQLVYFGFTHCPDVCPLGLNKIAEALNKMPKDTAAKIQPIFITVDPERDTAAGLKEYVGLFYPTLVGLTGTPQQIEQVKDQFKVYAQKQGDDEKDYMVNHSSYTYLMSPKGPLLEVYSHDTTAQEMADGIRKWVEEQ